MNPVSTNVKKVMDRFDAILDVDAGDDHQRLNDALADVQLGMQRIDCSNHPDRHDPLPRFRGERSGTGVHGESLHGYRIEFVAVAGDEQRLAAAVERFTDRDPTENHRAGARLAVIVLGNGRHALRGELPLAAWEALGKFLLASADALDHARVGQSLLADVDDRRGGGR